MTLNLLYVTFKTKAKPFSYTEMIFVLIAALFLPFDPRSLLRWLNWRVLVSSSFLITYKNKLIYSALGFIKSALNSLAKEFTLILASNYSKNSHLFFLTLFIFIFSNNFLGLFRYIFTPTSLIVISLSLRIFSWTGRIIFYFNSKEKLMVHLTPQNTPRYLISFIVFIERLRNLIRPITLSVRLTANITAGHLLLILASSILGFLPSFISQRLLFCLELVVSLVQAFVFTLLIVIYVRERN